MRRHPDLHAEADWSHQPLLAQAKPDVTTANESDLSSDSKYGAAGQIEDSSSAQSGQLQRHLQKQSAQNMPTKRKHQNDLFVTPSVNSLKVTLHLSICDQRLTCSHCGPAVRSVSCATELHCRLRSVTTPHDRLQGTHLLLETKPIPDTWCAKQRLRITMR